MILLDKESDIDRGIMSSSSIVYEVPFDSNEDVDGIHGRIYGVCSLLSLSS